MHLSYALSTLLFFVSLFVLPQWSAFADYTCEVKGSGLKVDPTYHNLAEATGGQVFSLDETDSIPTEILLPDIFLSGSGFSKNKTGGPIGILRIETVKLQHSLPVDSTMSKLWLKFSAGGSLKVRLTDPDGELVKASSRAKVYPTKSFCLVAVTNPKPGNWKIELSTKGKISIDARGKSKIEFYKSDYARISGGFHGTFWTERETPVVGEWSPLLNTVLGSENLREVTEFQLRDGEGKVLKSLKSETQHSNDYVTESFQVPSGLLRVYMIGEDLKGYPVQQVYSHSIEGRPYDPLDPDGRDENGVTSLMDAIFVGELERAKKLVEKGADVNARTSDGRTALMYAVEHKDVALIKMLLESGADVNKVDKYNGTAIYKATVHSNVEAVKILLKAGAVKDVRDGSGYTALEWATKKKMDGIYQLLESE